MFAFISETFGLTSVFFMRVKCVAIVNIFYACVIEM